MSNKNRIKISAVALCALLSTTLVCLQVEAVTSKDVSSEVIPDSSRTTDIKTCTSGRRESLDLAGFWRFRIDPDNKGTAENWMNTDTRRWDYIQVPGSWNEQSVRYDQYMGRAWYRRDVFIPESYKGKKVWLCFDGVALSCNVWINNVEVGQHEGAFTAFRLDISDAVKTGQLNRITVVADNTVSMESCPQGCSFNDLEIDWFNWGGIHRPVWIEHAPQCFIKDVSVVPRLDGGPCAHVIVEVANSVKSSTKSNLVLRVLDEDSRIIASTSSSLAVTAEGTAAVEVDLPVKNARLWSPDYPYLYRLQCNLQTDGGMDCCSVDFGMRMIEIAQDRFLLNGKPIWFKGFDVVSDLPGHGQSHAGAALRRDYDIMKRLNGNALRHGAYPPSREDVAMSDRLGIMQFVCLPSRKRNPKNIYAKDSMIKMADQWAEETVVAFKNNPSAVAWLLASEPPVADDSGKLAFAALYKKVKAMDPQRRPISYVANAAKRSSPWSDFLYLWCYPMTHVEYRDAGMKKLAGYVEEEHRAHPNRPVIIEWAVGAAAIGQHYDVPLGGTEEYQIERSKLIWEFITSRPYVGGSMIWVLFDYRIRQKLAYEGGGCVVGGEYIKGIYTRSRRPKSVAGVIKKLYGENHQ